MLRTRLQTDATTGAAQTWRRTLGSITQEGAAGRGVLNLWRGTSATVLRVGGGAAVHFYVLETLRAREDDVPWSKPVRNTFFGGVSRGAAVVLLCPITTVKTRMEASGAAAARHSEEDIRRSAFMREFGIELDTRRVGAGSILRDVVLAYGPR